MFDLSFIILSGGKNSRYQGKNKAFLKINDEYFIEKIVKIGRKISNDIIIVTNDIKAYNFIQDVKFTEDIYKNFGPLGGIHAGLKASIHEKSFVVSCDTPFIDAYNIKKMISLCLKFKADAYIPLVKNHKEPLHGIYRKKNVKNIENFFLDQEDLSIINFLKSLNTFFYIPDKSEEFQANLQNINSPEDYKKISDKYL